jgi:DNA-binding transcriptional MocR family regulator
MSPVENFWATPDFPTLQIALRPGIIDLSWGHPSDELLPVESLAEASSRALKRYGSAALTYGYPAGPGPLLEWLCSYIGEQEGRQPAVSEIMITGGNSQGLDQLLTLCTQPGDTVLVESPTYHLAVRILQDHPVQIVAVPMDQEGLQVDVLAERLVQLQQAGQTARLLYTIPTFHNPTGVSLSLSRRRALIDLALQHHLLIVEDDVYRELTYDGAAPPSLWSMAPVGVVARLGSFSKSLAPGLRLGWLTAGRSIIRRLAEGGLLDSGGGINHFTALVIAEFCASGEYQTQVQRFRHIYCRQRNALVDELAASLPATCSYSRPSGGFFAWINLPPRVDCRDLLLQAEASGVSFIPGCRFYLDHGGQESLRLAFSYYPSHTLSEAARILSNLIA